ncbi:MAG TPA: hypothetical protein VF037_02515 [Gemmatimonadales bacterium]
MTAPLVTARPGTASPVRPSLRYLLLSLAALFLAWEILGTIGWLEQAGTLGDGLAKLVEPLRRDRMQQVVTSDFLLIGAVVLVLLWLDAARRGWALPKRAALALGFIALGSPVLLTYLALRSERVGGEGRETVP